MAVKPPVVGRLIGVVIEAVSPKEGLLVLAAWRMRSLGARVATVPNGNGTAVILGRLAGVLVSSSSNVSGTADSDLNWCSRSLCITNYICVYEWLC
jgi:hypothetical protein